MRGAGEWVRARSRPCDGAEGRGASQRRRPPSKRYDCVTAAASEAHSRRRPGLKLPTPAKRGCFPNPTPGLKFTRCSAEEGYCTSTCSSLARTSARPSVAARAPGSVPDSTAARSASASAPASPNPRLTPCPARGCTAWAASPTSASRGSTYLAAKQSGEGRDKPLATCERSRLRGGGGE